MAIDKLFLNAVTARLKGNAQLQKLFDFFVDHLEEVERGLYTTPEFTEWEIFKLVAPKKYAEEWERQVGRNPSNVKTPEAAQGRNAIRRLRLILDRFSVSPAGRKLAVVASIPKEERRLVITLNKPYVKSFWAPYIRLSDAEQAPVRLMYTEHLFFYHREKKYVVRHLEVNDEHENIRDYLPFIPTEEGRLVAARHFVNASDVQAVLTLSNLFSELAIPIEYVDAQAGQQMGRLPPRDLVILGSPRTSPLIGDLQEELNLNFRLSRDSYTITNRSPVRGEDKEYKSEPRTKEALFGVVSRGTSEHLSASVTMVISSHGRFLAAMAHLLMDNENLSAMATQLGLQEGEAFPKTFEILFTLADTPRGDISAMRGYRPTIVAVRPEIRPPAGAGRKRGKNVRA